MPENGEEGREMGEVFIQSHELRSIAACKASGRQARHEVGATCAALPRPPPHLSLALALALSRGKKGGRALGIEKNVHNGGRRREDSACALVVSEKLKFDHVSKGVREWTWTSGARVLSLSTTSSRTPTHEYIHVSVCV